jgi:hypothetical protein
MKTSVRAANDWFNSCVMKRAYATEQDAYQKGMTSYFCSLCGNWHRASLKKPKRGRAKSLAFIGKWNVHVNRLKKSKIH